MKVLLKDGPLVLDIPGHGSIQRGVETEMAKAIALPHLHQGVLEPADDEATSALTEYRESLTAKKDNQPKE